jgi:AdoMet-dependent heme synthase
MKAIGNSIRRRPELMPSSSPFLPLSSLDALWFQVAGTVCNIECTHCFISCGPTNHAHEFLSLAEVRGRLEESIAHGVKEYYFTGGEPFLNREILEILEATLALGPATVLTNGMLIRPETARRLAWMESSSRYSLEIRISLDGFSEETNDAIRGAGVFRRSVAGLECLVREGFLPIITATRTWEGEDDRPHLEGFVRMLAEMGYRKPRIKLLPALKIGRESSRNRPYHEDERVTESMMEGFDTAALICSSSRIVTSRGVYVCPILIDESDARMGDTLQDGREGYALRHNACFSCYLHGAICSNFSSGGRNAG